ncbi:Iron-sulfur protein NUBPL [Halotydeus destructor]|nr:Iron-sulfur protein NUBPL [Halotydeus destructor]
MFVIERLIARRVCQLCCSLSRFSSSVKIPPEKVGRGLPRKIPVAGVRNVIVIASGKGGVGKSAVAVNLAFAIKDIEKDKSVGILDADVFGPSIPHMLNLAGQQPELTKQNLMIPLTNYGVKCMSMGFLVDPDSAIVWRGLMVMSAIDKLLRGVTWGPLDYLLIDMPPGTGDTQLSISQNIPISGAVIVTTPQKIALIDAKKAIVMFNKVDVNTLGIVQNMSYHDCANCHSRHHLFSKDGAKSLATEMDVRLLGDLPLDENIVSSSDAGVPFVLKYPDSPTSHVFRSMALKVLESLPEPFPV